MFGRRKEKNNTESDFESENSTSDLGTKNQIGGAAVAGGLVGAVLLGPVVGIIAAGGAAIAATTKGQAGDVARASGDAMAACGQKIKRFDQKHHIVDKTSRSITQGAKYVSKKLENKTQADLTQ